MKITTRLSILCLLMLLLTGCPEETIIVDPAQEWKAEFTVKNETSQEVHLILKTCDHYFDKTQGCWEIRQDSQKEEVKAGEQRTVVFQMIDVLTTKATLSFLAKVGGKTYIGWEKESLVDRQPQTAAPLQPEPVQDRLGYFHLENESATWHGPQPQAPRSSLPQGSPPTARYTQAVQDIIASATDSAQLLQVANAWVANLVAGTVLANQLMAKQLTVQDGGCIQSQNYKAGVSGWRIGSDGRAEFEDGVFRGEVNATSGVFNGTINATAGTFDGYLVTNGVNFAPCASVHLRDTHKTGNYDIVNGQNFYSAQRIAQGEILIMFKKSFKVKIFKALGSDNVIHNYASCVVTGNAHDTRDSYFYQCNISSGYSLVSIDGMPYVDVNTSTMTATIKGIKLFIADNNHDNPIDPVSLSAFIFFQHLVI